MHVWILRLRYLLAVHLFCPLGVHIPWPRPRFHPEGCAYCGKGQK
jgi:hypothetical protein